MHALTGTIEGDDDGKADSDFSVFIVFQPVAADFTSLGSFGTLEYVGRTLMPPEFGAPGVTFKLLEEAAVRAVNSEQ